VQPAPNLEDAACKSVRRATHPLEGVALPREAVELARRGCARVLCGCQLRLQACGGDLILRQHSLQLLVQREPLRGGELGPQLGGLRLQHLALAQAFPQRPCDRLQLRQLLALAVNRSARIAFPPKRLRLGLPQLGHELQLLFPGPRGRFLGLRLRSGSLRSQPLRLRLQRRHLAVQG